VTVPAPPADGPARPTGGLTPETVAVLRDGAAAERERVLAFCRDLVRIPSPPGDERKAVEHAAAEMATADYDEVRLDRAGNALGIVRARGGRGGGAVLLDAHLDHVHEGASAAWHHPPFKGVVERGRLWGRGASDTKSAVAAQVRAGALLARLQRQGALKLERDVVVAAVVQEEVGGLGTSCLLEDGLPFAAAVIGEPSAGALAHGHRGRVELEVRFTGRSAHAGRPAAGVNPHRSLARFIPLLDEVERGEDERFGASTVCPTLVRAEPPSANVVPSLIALTLDWRNVPAEAPHAVHARIERLARQACEAGAGATVRVPDRELVAWTGVKRRIPRVAKPFATDPASPLFRTAAAGLAAATGRAPQVIAWEFASDAGWLHAAGVPCIGYGPGDPTSMHVVDESVDVRQLEEAVLGYAALALALGSKDATP